MKTKKVISSILIFTFLMFNFISMTSIKVARADGTGTVDSPFTVAQAIALQDNSVKTVQGYLIGQPVSALSVVTVATADTAVAIADTPGETDVNKMLFVQLLTTPAYVRANYGLKTNPSMIGTKVNITGNLTPYFTPHVGLKNTTAITTVSVAPPTVINVTGVTLNKTALTLNIGQNDTLIPTIAPANATNTNVTWSSDNNAVATVTNGVVVGVSQGTANITVTTVDGNKTSLCVVTVSANAPPVNKTFDIVEITDFHGQLLDSTNTKPVGAALAYVIKNNVIANNPNRTLVIGGGDLYQGTPVSNVLHGVPVQKVMSNIGMEVTALGNHEFDWGLNVINNETMIGANYEIVCANLYNKGTNVRAYNPYKIITKDGVRIAVIGGILKDAPSIIMPALTAPYDFRDVATEINACAKEIRDGNLADVVLADIHDGGDSLNTIVNNLHGVDAVFGGHTHTTYDGINSDADGKNIPTLNAAATGQGYIDLKITVDPSNKIVSFSSKGQNWKSLTTTVSSPTDPTCKQIVDDASAALLPIFNEVIGNDPVAYTSTQVDSPYGESQLGNWMSDVIKNYVNADVGMQNNGGIRLSPVPAGNITVGTIFNLMPFDNTICYVNMTGAQLKYIFEQAVQQTGGKGIQISGVRFIYDASKPGYKPAVVAPDGTITTPEVPGQRVLSIIRETDGSIVKDTDILKVAAPDFVATGGDTFTGFLNPSIVSTFVDTHVTVRDALNLDVRAKGKITVVMNNRVDNQMQVVDPKAMSIAEARTTTLSAVILTGTVTAVNGSNVFMQDDPTAPTAGICVYNTGGKTFTAVKGDKITVTGNLSVYNGLLEITPTSAAAVVKVSAGNAVTPKVVKIGEITNALQGQFIKVKNVTFTSIDNTAHSMAQDSTGSIDVYKMPVVPGLAVGDIADVSAAVTIYGTTLELAADNAGDIVKLQNVTGVQLDKSSIALKVGESQLLTATVAPDNASNKTVSFTSSNPAVATLDNNGLVTPVDGGTAVITVTTADGNYTAKCDVTVTVPVSGVMLDKTRATINYPDTLSLVASVMPSNATNKKVNFTSSNQGVATVDGNGLVTSIDGGTTEIIASTEDGTFIAKCTLTVNVPVLGVTIDKTNAAIKYPETLTLIATVLPINASNKKVNFTSSNPSVATVDGNGLVTPVDGGTADIIATTEDGSFIAKCTITVSVPVTGITLDKTNATININGTINLNSTIAPTNATNKAVIWSSDNTEVALVDNNGLVKAVKDGDATITVTTLDGSFVAKCAVTVVIPVTGIELNNSSVTIKQGGTSTLIAKVLPLNATNNLISWASDNQNVATVDNDGVIKAVDGGMAIITATTIDGSFTARCTVTVIVPVTGVSFDNRSLILNLAQSQALKVNIMPENATNKLVNWTSDKPSIVKVDSNGNITGVSLGVANVTATTLDGGFKTTCKITVVIPVTSIVLNKNSLDLRENQSFNLQATVSPKNATYKKVIWTSSNPLVATVDQNGIVKAKGSGTCDITAAVENSQLKAVCKVNVSIPVKSIKLDTNYLLMKVGTSKVLNATVLPTNCTNKNIIWCSTCPQVVSVDKDGNVTANGVGIGLITAMTEDGNYIDECIVLVTK